RINLNAGAASFALRLPFRGSISAAQSSLTPMFTRLLTLAFILSCVAGAPAPYDGDLQRLAEIMGALHYLRGVCGSKEGQKWRDEMQSLIDAEAPSGDRRQKIVASFNRGYRGFQQTYRTCTPAADVAIRRYLDEGAKIAREITARYAN